MPSRSRIFVGNFLQQLIAVGNAHYFAAVVLASGQRAPVGISKAAELLEIPVAPKLFPFDVLAFVGGRRHKHKAE